MRRSVILSLSVLLLGVFIGRFWLHDASNVVDLVDLDPYIVQLLNSPNGGTLILLSGEYESSIIYGPEGLIRWRTSDER